jgi:hypothetical protein
MASKSIDWVPSFSTTWRSVSASVCEPAIVSSLFMVPKKI